MDDASLRWLPLSIHMPGPLNSDEAAAPYSADESLRALMTALNAAGLSRVARAQLQQEVSNTPDQLFTAAMSALEHDADPVLHRDLYLGLCECPEFLMQLVRPDRFTRTQSIEVSRRLVLLDDQLDLRLARLIPGRQDDPNRMSSEVVVRILEILQEISAGPRLILILSHLTQHEDKRVVSKATLLIGQRLRNQHWTKRRMESDDARLRASVLEGLWRTDTPAAREALRAGLRDENNRVVGNALVGLFLMGEPSVDAAVAQMLKDPRPAFRRTAAWVMGRIGKPEFGEPLRQALSDDDQGVRFAAKAALITIRAPVLRQQRELEATRRKQESESRVPPPEESSKVPVGPAAAPAKKDTKPPNPPEDSSPEAPEEGEAEPAFNVRLDGSFRSGS